MRYIGDGKATDVATRMFETIKDKLMSGDWQEIESDDNDVVDRVLQLVVAWANKIGAHIWLSDNVGTARSSIRLTPTRHTRQ